MNKTKEYVYEVSEQSTDIRYFEIVSDKKLTESEILDAICLPNISKVGDCITDDGITVTYLWTDYGDDAQFDVDGELANDK